MPVIAASAGAYTGTLETLPYLSDAMLRYERFLYQLPLITEGGWMALTLLRSVMCEVSTGDGSLTQSGSRYP